MLLRLRLSRTARIFIFSVRESSTFKVSFCFAMTIAYVITYRAVKLYFIPRAPAQTAGRVHVYSGIVGVCILAPVRQNLIIPSFESFYRPSDDPENRVVLGATVFPQFLEFRGPKQGPLLGPRMSPLIR